MIKKLLSISACMVFSQFTFGQALTNGGFESWFTTTYDNLDDYETSMAGAYLGLGQINTTKVSDSQNGTYAIKMETVSNGIDTVFGYFINGSPDNGEGGVPYSQSPTTIDGFYKCDVALGDSALLFVMFKSGGAQIGGGSFTFTGTQNTYTAFSFPIGTITGTPDSVIIGAASSNAINNIGVTPGSTLQLDNISFGGTGITQAIPNGDFENWTAVSIEDPTGWSTRNTHSQLTGNNVQALNSVAANSGSYALQLTTTRLDFEDKTFYVGDATNGNFTSDGYDHGVPYTETLDTLTGYYKYFPSGSDTAGIVITCYKNGAEVATTAKIFTGTTSSYTMFEIPFACSPAPDSMRIGLYSSATDSIVISQVGSAFILDDLAFASDAAVVPTSINTVKDESGVSVYPNPAVSEINFKLNGGTASLLEISDASGAILRTVSVNAGIVNVSAASFAAGQYIYRLSDDQGNFTTGKFSIVK